MMMASALRGKAAARRKARFVQGVQGSGGSFKKSPARFLRACTLRIRPRDTMHTLHKRGGIARARTRSSPPIYIYIYINTYKEEINGRAVNAAAKRVIATTARFLGLPVHQRRTANSKTASRIKSAVSTKFARARRSAAQRSRGGDGH